jgi:hypothetical protein
MAEMNSNPEVLPVKAIFAFSSAAQREPLNAGTCRDPPLWAADSPAGCIIDLLASYRLRWRHVYQVSFSLMCSLGIVGSFKIHAETRGKELRLRLTPVNGGAPQWLLFTHGLVGRWAFSSADSLPNAARVSFYASNNEVLR